MRRLVLRSHLSQAPTQQTLDAITDAVDLQLHDVAMYWGEYVWHLLDRVFGNGFEIGLFDNSDQAGALGYHDVGTDGRPYARIFIEPILSNGGDWLHNNLSVASVVSHEVCELIGDPGANRWADDFKGAAWALELCDAVEADSYRIATTAGLVTVSNFVTPEYFNPFGHGPFDVMGRLASPFEIGVGGYAIRMADGHVSQVFGEQYPDWRQASKLVAGSRTHARLAMPS